MSIKDKTSLKTDNDTLYDDAIGLTQEVTATNQKTVTNDQIDSNVMVKDRIISVDVSVTPTAIVLDFSNNEQFILDLTSQPATKIFAVTSILGIVSGQNNKIQVDKNADQSITLTPASGPIINKAVNPLQITGIGSPVSFVYSYLDDSNATAASLISLEVFVDSVGGDDNNDGLTQANAVKTDDRAYTIVENSNIFTVFITRKRGGTYIIVNDHSIGERSLTFLEYDAGAAPVVSSSGGELTISGLFAMFVETLSSAASSSYFNVIDSFKVNLFGGELIADQSVIFRGGDGNILSFFINPIVDISGVTVATITDMPVRAVDVVGSTSLISGFADNTLSTILNVNDGLSQIIDVTFKGEVVPLGFSSIVKLVEKGMDKNKNTWTVEDAGINVGGIESINFLDSEAFSNTARDTFINSAGTKMFVLNDTNIIQAFDITGGDIATQVIDGGNTIDLDATESLDDVVSIDFSPTGNFLIVANGGANIAGGIVRSISLGSNFDLTSNGSSSSFTPGSQAGNKDDTPLGIKHTDDGLTLMMTGNDNKNVYRYTLGAAFNYGTVTFNDELHLGGTPSGVHLSFNELIMYIWDYSQGRLVQYSLGSKHILDGALVDEINIIKVGGSSPTVAAGIHLNDVQNKMYLINNSTRVVEQYNFNGGRIYEIKKNGSSFDPSNYRIRGSVENENNTEISTVAFIRNPSDVFVTVANGASIRKDFSLQIYKK